MPYYSEIKEKHLFIHSFGKLYTKKYRLRFKMQPNQISTLIIGSWNPRIFTPLWIKKNLFGLNDGDEIQGLVDFENLSFAFQYEGITVIPKSNSIEISFDNLDEKKTVIVSGIVSKIFELLPQTPIKALGVNFRYKLDKSIDNPLVKVLRDVNLGYQDFVLNQTRQSVNRGNYQINIISDIENQEVLVNVNFHYHSIIAFSSDFIGSHYEETQKILGNGS